LKKDTDTDLFSDYKMDAALFENENSTEEFDYYEDDKINEINEIETSEDAVDNKIDDKMQSESATENNISSLKDDSHFLEMEYTKEANKVDSQKMSNYMDDDYESNELKSIETLSSETDADAADEDLEAYSSERQNLWIPFDRDQDLQDYQDNFSPRYQDYQDAARDQGEFLQADVLQEPESDRLRQENFDSSVVMSDPSPKFMASFSSGTMINIVRSVLVICLLTRFWM